MRDERRPDEMIDYQLSHLLTRLPSDDGRPSRHCPDEHRLAAYAERRLPGAERSLLESHLADCGSCLGQVA
ncbi:MAG TPA: zf-HC2 domain-containing protein, partial [Thermoanaerobaculia bacterium]|nr:zf-HC2 domain-containing protein [Thermoanaerobaculia bacterium]